MTTPNQSAKSIDDQLQDVRELMAKCLSQTVLGKLGGDCKSLLATGKMLRARLCLRLGAASQVPYDTLIHAAASVELIHGASLLHDDVIDGGYLRRGVPTFWVERGVPGAILVGDLMLFKALDLMSQVEDARLTVLLIQMTGEVCDAESEQELVLRGKEALWEDCVAIARRKTGALFAFAAAANGGSDSVLTATLKEAGYAIGTAYQLADDVLDVSGTEVESGKTLGTDSARKKTTAVSTEATSSVDAVSYIEMLCREAEKSLDAWPNIKHAWRTFVNADLRPILNRILAPNPA